MPIMASRVGTRRAPFAPTQLTGLGVWFDAAQITGATDVSAVATWQDRSGNGWNAAQATSAKQPIYLSTGALITPTGRPVVQFDGVGMLLDCSAGSSQTPTQTLFVVARATSFPAKPDPTYSLVASTVGGGLAFQYSNTGALIRIEDDAVAGKYAVAYSPGTTLFHLCSGTYDSAVGSHIYVDGAEIGAGGGITGGFTGTGFRRIGGSFGSTKAFAGVMAEIVVYTRVLSTAERQQVEVYLKAKHGTP